MTVELRCVCGAFRGRVRDATPAGSSRVVCYCDDCQAFARFLGRDKEILDAQGGTDIVQVSQAQIEIVAGADRLAVMRLTDKGTFRWHTSCCRTPLGNTLSNPGVPFIGLIHRIFPDAASPGRLDAAFGPVNGSVFQQFARGGATAVPKGGAPLYRILLRFGRLVLGWGLRGDRRRSPLFGFEARQCIVRPRVLSNAERAALYASSS